MAEISKQALKVVNNTNFPNNNSGEISPSDLRSFNVDMIDSTVNQATYTSDSASWNASIDALEQFTSSQQPSFTALNAFTASQLNINSGVNSFTSSADSRLDTLELETAALESFTASINQIQERGVVKGTSTRLNFGGGAFVTASIVANVGGAIADITINSDTTKTGTGSFNAYTQSTDARINSLEQFTASLDTTYVTQAELAAATGALEDSIDTKLNTSSFDSFSASADQRLDSIESQSGSWVTAAITASSLVTASFDNGTRNLTFTKGDSSTFNVNIPDVSGSSGNFVTTSSFNAFTQSIEQRVDSLEAATSSYAISSSVAAVDAAQQSQINALIAFTGSVTASINTGSFATTGSNTFTGNQTITTGGNTQLNIISTGGGQANVDFQAPNSNFRAYGLFQINNNGQYGGSGSIQLLAKDNNIILAADGGFQLGQTNGVGNGIGAGAVTINVPTGSNTLQLTGSLIVSNQITASNTLFNGDVIINPTTSTKLNGNTDVGSFLYIGGGLTLNSSAAITWLGSGSIDGNFSSSIASQFAAITPTSTGSLLVTASAAGSDITFTKGDGSTFSVTVATGSVVSASYAETASIARNLVVVARNGNQSTLPIGTVVHITSAVGDNPIFNTASFDTELLSANTLGVLRQAATSGTDVEVVVQGTVTGVNTDPTLGYAAGDVIYLSSSGEFTRVQPQAPNQIVVLGQVLRAQQNNGSIYVSINNGWELNELHNVQITSPQTNELLAYESSSYGLWKNKSFSQLGLATTGSNTFSGNQTVDGFVSASNGFRVGGSANALEIGDGSNIRFLTGSSNFYNIQLVPGVGDIAFSRDGVSNVKTFTLAGAAGASTTFQNNPVVFQSSVTGVTFSTPISVNSGINTNVDITGSLKISSTFDAPLTQGYVWVGDASGRTTTVATSSFGGTTDLSSLNSFTASQYVSNSYFATTGSNNFRGVESIGDVVGSGQGEVYLLGKSGSLVLTNSTVTPTYASLAHISSSQINANTNLIFKTNTGTPSTIVSGSNNIFANPAGVTAGFNRYVGGASNIYLNVVPQLTGSAAFPVTMANNISNAGVIFRAPVSSSTYTVSSNLLMNGASTALSFGTSAANNFERAVSGLNVTNNIIAGAISAVAAKTPLSASSNMSANTIGGTVTLNYDSSSINLNGATVQGTLTVNNSYFPSTVNTNAALGINSGVFIGGSTIYASGSNATFTSPRLITNTTMFGGANVISASFNGDNTNVHSTNLIGQSLTVYATNSRPAGPTGADWGSVFAGRWNDLGGTKAYTAETVFAVGTGTGASTRKTGFLIDSGSNTFVEGTLNISGSSTFNGDVYITGSSAGSTALNVGGYIVMKNIPGQPYTYLDIQSTNASGVGAGISITGKGSSNYLLDAGTYRTGFTLRDGTSGNTIFSVITGSTAPVVFERDVVVTGSTSISNVLQLAQLDPLPAGATGQLAVSASLLWFYDSTQWKQVSLV